MKRNFLCCVLSAMVVLCSTSLRAQSPFWQSTSGPFGGRVHALAAGGAGDVFAATDGGVFRTTDNGVTWNATGAIDDAVNALLVKGTIVFAGTNSGVFVSVDTGANWSPSFAANADFYAYAFANDAAGTVFAGSLSSASSESGAVYASTDNGGTWQIKQSGIPDQTNVYALDASVAGVLLAGTDRGMYRSTTGGASWEQVGLAATTVNAITLYQGVLFAGTLNGVARSQDNGARWTPGGITGYSVNAFAQHGGNLYAASDTAFHKYSGSGVAWTIQSATESFALAAAFAPDGSALVGIYGTSGVVRSTNDGALFTTSNTGLTATILSVCAADNGAIIAGTYGGAYRYTPATGGWAPTQLGTLYDVQTIYNAGNNVLLAGTDDGAFLSTDGGITWADGGLVGVGVFQFLVTDIANIFACTDGGMYHRTGITGTWLQQGLSSRAVNCAIQFNATELCAGTDSGSYQSTDVGTTWQPTGLFDTTINAFAMLGVGDTPHSLLMGATRGLYHSTNGGKSWTQIGIKDSTVRTLATNDVDVYAGTYWGAHFSQDGGVTWQGINAGLADSSVSSIIIDPFSHYVYAGTDAGGVARSVSPVVILDVKRTAELPGAFAIAANYPNPASTNTTVEFDLPEVARVEISIVNAVGEIVQHVDAAQLSAGHHAMSVDAGHLPAGIYHCRVQAGARVAERSIVVVR